MTLAAAAERHNAVRGKVRSTILELLAERPIGPKPLTARVLERVPDATREDVAAVRTLLRAKTGQIEMRANKLCLSGYDRTGPITALEREVVECLGEGKTAREVVDACTLVRNAFSARSILSALVSRGVVGGRSEGSSTIYTATREAVA